MNENPNGLMRDAIDRFIVAGELRLSALYMMRDTMRQCIYDGAIAMAEEFFCKQYAFRDGSTIACKLC